MKYGEQGRTTLKILTYGRELGRFGPTHYFRRVNKRDPTVRLCNFKHMEDSQGVVNNRYSNTSFSRKPLPESRKPHEDPINNNKTPISDPGSSSVYPKDYLRYLTNRSRHRKEATRVEEGW